jgi:hypothetical protein
VPDHRVVTAAAVLPSCPEEEEMVMTIDPRRNTDSHRRRLADDREFTEILTFSLLGLALSLFAIGQGWLGPVEYAASLLLLLR